MTADPPNRDAEAADDAEEALNWDTSSRDASYVEGPTPVVEKPVREKRARAERGGRASTGSETESAAPVEAAPISSILLVTYGIVAGVFLLYAIGWFTTVRRDTYVDPNALGAIMWTLGQALAVAAAPVWFGAVFWLTRASKPITRLLWLLLGLVLLVPVPFVLGV